MATLTHGSNADCPRVRSGEWKFCKGHSETLKPARLKTLAREANPCPKCSNKACALARYILLRYGYHFDENEWRWRKD